MSIRRGYCFAPVSVGAAQTVYDLSDNVTISAAGLPEGLIRFELDDDGRVQGARKCDPQDLSEAEWERFVELTETPRDNEIVGPYGIVWGDEVMPSHDGSAASNHAE